MTKARPIRMMNPLVAFIVLLLVMALQKQFQAEQHVRNTLLRLDEDRADVLEGLPLHNYQYKVVDVLSIGSQERPELQITQQESFASHISTRHFFNATEADDGDPLCHSHLMPNATFNISIFCKHRKPDLHPIRHHLQGQFANVKWLQQKKNPVGWLCAQRRPLHGLYKVLQQYNHSGEKLPDYLVVLDDDTYFNMERFQQLIRDDDTQHDATEHDQPHVFAGCLVRRPVHEANFTFPFGGYGTIFNRASLQNLMRPIVCPANTQTCEQIQQNIWGEKHVFENGMSLVELIQAFANYMPYRDYARGLWKKQDGFCLHSDWAIGYFVNFYNISSHTTDPFYAGVPQSRMEEWHDSAIYSSKKGFCQNENVENCRPGDVTCHYMTAEAMVNYTNVVRSQVPADRFRDRRRGRS